MAPASKLEPFLHGPFVRNAAKGHAMITMSIGVAAGVFYWLAWYKLAFWILIYAIIYGGLGALRGDNQAQTVYRARLRRHDRGSHPCRLAHWRTRRLSLADAEISAAAAARFDTA
jgi:hypothetical protein